ncbi:MAG: type 2 isopentenyl-diphosphate Delta-isomerase [Negativicutes bacterium]|nr:type 2 isopentenyl-diphosphate Delta-isomerase [Negativicutes bacterium]
MRQSRKLEHIRHAAALPDGPQNTYFADISLIHNCLPDLTDSEVEMTTEIAGIPLRHPFMINAITGGAEAVADFNGRIAEIAKVTHSAMAVGSQYAGLEFPEMADTYRIVRKVNPSGIIFANLGAHASPEQAKRAVDMIGAQALQIHLNVAQEIVMAEGDRSFVGYLHNIEKIVRSVDVPVIVKEVGCGIAREQAVALVNVGVRALDVGGAGGTNFIAIEAARLGRPVSPELAAWGIPTAISLLETLDAAGGTVDVIASGGIRTPLEAVKALALGAAGIGAAGPVIKLVLQKDSEAAAVWIRQFLAEMKQFVLLTGARNCSELCQKPVVITGFVREWLLARGINITEYRKRKRHS